MVTNDKAVNKSIVKYLDTSKSIIITIGEILDDTFERDEENVKSSTVDQVQDEENLKSSSAGYNERLITEAEVNNYENEVKGMMIWDMDDDSDGFVRADEEIMITPSTTEKHVSVNYQNVLNQQQFDSVEKPLKRVSKLSKLESLFVGSMFDSGNKSEYQKSNSFIVPKIELSLIKDNQNTGRPMEYQPDAFE